MKGKQKQQEGFHIKQDGNKWRVYDRFWRFRRVFDSMAAAQAFVADQQQAERGKR